MMNSIQGYSRLVAKEFLPAKARRWLRSHVSSDYTPPVGKVSFGDLRRTKPIGSDFGFSRGDAVDRHYIEAFLEENAMAVRGRVMEIAENTYTRKFGGDRVERSDVL